MTYKIVSPISSIKYISTISNDITKLDTLDASVIHSVDKNCIDNLHMDMYILARKGVNMKWIHDILGDVDTLPKHIIKFLSPILRHDEITKYLDDVTVSKLVTNVLLNRDHKSYIDWFIPDDVIDDAVENYGIQPCKSTDEDVIQLYEERLIANYARMIVNSLEYQLAILYDSMDYDSLQFAIHDESPLQALGISKYEQSDYIIAGIEQYDPYNPGSSIYIPYINDDVYNIFSSSIGLNIYIETFIAISKVVRCDLMYRIEDHVTCALSNTNRSDYLHISDTVSEKLVVDVMRFLLDTVQNNLKKGVSNV